MILDILKKSSNLRFCSISLFLLLVVVAEIALTIIIPEWRKGFYNVLESKEVAEFYSSMWMFAALMFGLGLVQGLKTWLGRKVSYRVREAWTKISFKAWVKGSRTAPNSGVAMTSSMQQATELYLNISMEIFISLFIVIALVVVNLGNPGVLIGSGIYTVVASAVALIFKTPLISSDTLLQKAEGSFRDNIVIVGSGEDSHKFKELLLELTSKYFSYIKVAFYFTMFSRVKGSLAVLVPYLIYGGVYMSGGMSLGTFMAAVATFELIVANSTIVLAMYPDLMKARASYKIVDAFYREVINDKPI